MERGSECKDSLWNYNSQKALPLLRGRTPQGHAKDTIAANLLFLTEPEHGYLGRPSLYTPLTYYWPISFQGNSAVGLVLDCGKRDPEVTLLLCVRDEKVRRWRRARAGGAHVKLGNPWRLSPAIQDPKAHRRSTCPARGRHWEKGRSW